MVVYPAPTVEMLTPAAPTPVCLDTFWKDLPPRGPVGWINLDILRAGLGLHQAAQVCKSKNLWGISDKCTINYAQYIPHQAVICHFPLLTQNQIFSNWIGYRRLGS